MSGKVAVVSVVHVLKGVEYSGLVEFVKDIGVIPLVVFNTISISMIDVFPVLGNLHRGIKWNNGLSLTVKHGENNFIISTIIMPRERVAPVTTIIEGSTG